MTAFYFKVKSILSRKFEILIIKIKMIRKMPMKTIESANKLIYEKSPYLLQHAYNPVDWYPWGDKAFTKAKQEDKPVFISVGYSTCHW